MDPLSALRAADDDGLATTSRLAEAGLGRSQLTRAVQTGRLVRVRPGVYAEAALPPLTAPLVVDDSPAPLLVRHVRAVLLSLGSSAVPTGITAAMLRGWGVLAEPVELSIGVRHGRSRVRMPGVRAVQQRRLVASRVRVGGAYLRLPPVWHTVITAALQLPLLEAVVLVDSALRARATQLPDLRARAARLPGHTEAARVREVLALCDERCGSVLESALRMRMVLAGITGFETQKVLRRAGAHVLRADFCFEAARLVVEVDGSRWHDRAKDRRTDNQLVALGYRVLRFTWAEVVHGHEDVLTLIREALGSQDFHLPARAASAA